MFNSLKPKQNIKWLCQLKPTKDFDLETMQKLKEGGLSVVLWGVESGCDRILDLMNKTTNKTGIAKVLRDSKDAGITNAIFIMLGFPSETQDEFIETMNFLEKNNENIDIISTSIFGLQEGSLIYDAPSKFSISKINKTKRTLLDESISYDLESGNFGLTQEEANKLRKKYNKIV